MKSFRDLGIQNTQQGFIGDKIKINKILNRQVVVNDYKIENSKYEKGSGKCLHMQISIGETKHVVFTGSKRLMDTLELIPKTDFPFSTTIVKENDWFDFT